MFQMTQGWNYNRITFYSSHMWSNRMSIIRPDHTKVSSHVVIVSHTPWIRKYSSSAKTIQLYFFHITTCACSITHTETPRYCHWTSIGLQVWQALALMTKMSKVDHPWSNALRAYRMCNPLRHMQRSWSLSLGELHISMCVVSQLHLHNMYMVCYCWGWR